MRQEHSLQTKTTPLRSVFRIMRKGLQSLLRNAGMTLYHARMTPVTQKKQKTPTPISGNTPELLSHSKYSARGQCLFIAHTNNTGINLLSA